MCRWLPGWLALLAIAAPGCYGDVPTIPAPAAGVPAEMTSPLVYAELCKSEMELPPEVLEPWNCLEGLEIPTTVGGAPLDDATYKALAAGEVGCDSPSWFPGLGCNNYAFVQHRQLSDDVDAVLLCRMRSWSGPEDRAGRLAALEAEGTTARWRSLWTFDSLGMIWSHRENGTTCYFERVAPLYGGYVASPDDPRVPDWEDLPEPRPPAVYEPGSGSEDLWRHSGETRWEPPLRVAVFGRCIVCHDSGPFVRTPWLADLGVVPPNPDAPYHVPGLAFETWEVLIGAHAISTAPVPRADGAEDAQVCTSCHRIGGHETCSNRVGFATGDEPVPQSSDWAWSSILSRTTMPPAPESWHAMEDGEVSALWEELYRDHVDMLACCCADPTALGCTRQDLMASPLEVPVAGAGPASCYPVPR